DLAAGGELDGADVAAGRGVGHDEGVVVGEAVVVPLTRVALAPRIGAADLELVAARRGRDAEVAGRVGAGAEVAGTVGAVGRDRHAAQRTAELVGHRTAE